METKMKKTRITYKVLFYLLLAVLLLSLVPMLMICRYDVPCADDFTYGAAAHLKYMETGSALQAVLAGAKHTADTYLNWQGSFSAVFLMAVQPAVFGESFYGVGAVIVMAALIAGVFCLCAALFSGVFGLQKSVGGCVAAVILLLCIQLVLSPVQGFYWYNGAVYYGFFYGLSLLTFALGIRTVRRGGRLRLALLCVLAFVLGGGNYVTALTCAIIGFCSIALLLLLKNKNWKKLLLPVAFLMAAFLVSIIAPGNAVRQSSVSHSPNAVTAILNSFQCGAVYSVSWFSLPMAGALLFLAVIFWNNASRAAIRFRYPGLVTIYSYCLLSAMFCPTMYALGSIGDKRLVNIIYYAYVLLLAINCFYWIGWIKPRIMKARESGGAFPLRGLLAAAACCLVCCGVYARGHGFTSLMAIGAMRSGEAREYYECAQKRLESLNNGIAEDLVLEPYSSRPYLLFFDDITQDAADWRNVAMSEYYGEHSVILAEESARAEK